MLYEAQHPPTYYWLVSPIWRAFSGDQTGRAVAVLRLLNLAFSAGALLLILLFLGRACRDRRHAMLLSLWVAFQPLLLLNSVRVANDALAFLLGTAVVVGTLLLLTRPPQRFIRSATGLGLLLGAALLIKATNLALLPFVAGVLAVAVVTRRVTVRTGVLAILGVAVATLAVASTLYLWNWRHYHLLVPVQQAFINRAHHLTRLEQWRYFTAHCTDVLPQLLWNGSPSTGFGSAGGASFTPGRFSRPRTA